MSYTYAVTSQRATAVHFAKVCYLTSSEDKNLVLAKGNRIEVHKYTVEGLQLETEFPLYGRIASLGCYRPHGQLLDVLFVLTEKKQFTVLGYDTETKEFNAKFSGSLKDKLGHDRDSGIKGILGPENRMVGMLLCEGMIKIIPIEQSGMKESFNSRLEISRILDCVFLHGQAKPCMAVLFEDHRMQRHVKTYTVDTRERELMVGPWQQDKVNDGAKMLIPVPAPACGKLESHYSILFEVFYTYLSSFRKQSLTHSLFFFLSYII